MPNIFDREDKIRKEIQQEFIRRVIPSDIVRYLPCLTTPDVEKIQCEEKQNGATSAAGILLDRLVRRPDWINQLQKALLNPDIGLNDFGEKFQQICQQLTITVEAPCTDGIHCGHDGQEMEVAPAAACPQPVETAQEVEQRLKCKVLEKLLDFVTQKEQIAEMLEYGKAICVEIDKIAKGSINITFRFETIEKLEAFWQLYHTGGLAASLSRDILTAERRQQMIYDARSNEVDLTEKDFYLQVSIEESDYLFVKDILTNKNVPLLARNTVESTILHGTGNQMLPQYHRNRIMKTFRRQFPADLQRCFDDAIIRDTIPEYLIQVTNHDARYLIQSFYKLVIEKLRREFSDELYNDLDYLAYFLSACPDYECNLHEHEDNVELSAADARTVSISKTSWQTCSKFFMINQGRIKFASDLAFTFLAVKYLDRKSGIGQDDNFGNVFRMELFPLIAGVMFESHKMATLVKSIDLNHMVIVKYMYYRMVFTDKIEVEPVNYLYCLNVDLTKDTVQLLQRVSREGAKLKLLIYAPENSRRADSASIASYELEVSHSESETESTTANFPTIALHKPENGDSDLPVFWFNYKTIVSNCLLIPDSARNVLSFLICIAQAINLLGSGEIRIERGTDPTQTILQYDENVEKFTIVSYQAQIRATAASTEKITTEKRIDDVTTKESIDIHDHAHTGILKMDLSSFPLRKNDITTLAQAFNDGLEMYELNITNTGVDADHVTMLCQSAITASISHVILNDNKLFTGQATESKGLGLRNLVSLEVLEMRKCGIEDTGMMVLKRDLAELHKLRSVDFSKNGLSEYGVGALCQALRDIRAIRAIRIHENNIGPNGGLILSMLIEGLQFLEIINVSHCELGDTGTVNLARSLQNKKIKKMNFRCNNITQQGSAEFFRLMQCCKQLNHLEYGNNAIGMSYLSSDIPMHGVVASVPRGTGDASEPFIDMLESSQTSIEYLGLWQCGIGNTSILDSTKVFSNMPELTEIILQANELEDKHAITIGKCLPSLKSLQCLMLRSNNIGPTGARELITGIGSCKSLRSIILDRNKINDLDVLRQMIEVSTINLENLQKLDLSYNVELVLAREDAKYKKLLETVRKSLPDPLVEEEEMQTKIESKSTIIVI